MAQLAQRRLRVCYFGTYSDQSGYPMNRVPLAALRAAGVEVITCHERVFDNAADKMAASGVGGGIKRAGRLLAAWWRLSRKFSALPDYDVLVVGYVGHLDIFLARLLGGLLRPRPVVLNALISLHDTVVTDRTLIGPRHPLAWCLKALDRAAFALAQRILIDTDVHGAALSEKYAVPRHKWLRVAVGADPDGVSETPASQPNGTPITVLYFGTYIALHGVSTIIAAARLLAGRDDVRFVMLGQGQGLAAAQQQAQGLRNMVFEPRWVDRPELLAAIAQADICLGVFGAGEKAGRVIPCKVYDALALARPVISADTAGIRELLADGQHARLVPRADAAALAAAVTALADDPAQRTRLAEAGYQRFRERCTVTKIGQQLADDLRQIIDS